MNYRHGFHAGNFADVLKHIVLTRILAYLALKPAPFCLIDSHAGGGLYDLAADEADRTGEWRDGIARLLAEPLPADVAVFVQPYLDLIAAARARHGSMAYPGSPWLGARLLRASDRLVACELHPPTYRALVAALGQDRRCKLLALDGWTGLRANLPPKERRGLALIDPPFEKTDEFATFAKALAGAYAKWPTGIYMGWFPLKNPAAADEFIVRLTDSGVKRLLRLDLLTGRQAEKGGLGATGLVIVNPPWTLEGEARLLLPFLASRLAQGEAPGYHIATVASDG